MSKVEAYLVIGKDGVRALFFELARALDHAVKVRGKVYPLTIKKE